MGVDAIHRKGDDAAVLLRIFRAQHMNAGDILNTLHSPPGQIDLLPVHILKAHAVHIVNGGMKPHSTGGIDRTGLKLVRQLRVDRALPGDGFDHLAAGKEGRHLLQQRLPAVQHTDSHGAVDLMAGKGQEVRSQRLHIHGNMGRALGTVHHHDRAAPMSQLRDLPDGVHPAQNIGDLRAGHDFCFRCDESLHLIKVQRTVHFAFHEFQRRAGLAAYHLPWQQIAVVLHNGHQNLIPGLHMGQSVAVGH